MGERRGHFDTVVSTEKWPPHMAACVGEIDAVAQAFRSRVTQKHLECKEPLALGFVLFKH